LGYLKARVRRQKRTSVGKEGLLSEKGKMERGTERCLMLEERMPLRVEHLRHTHAVGAPSFRC
jgi:hypothetical protein